MITFGYTNKFSGPIRALVAVALGIIMILAGDEAMNFVVKIIAVFVIASGVVSLLVGYKNKSNGTMPLMTTNAVFDILIGVALFAFDAFFANLFIYLIGFILLLFGLFQLVVLGSANSIFRVGWFAFLMPAIVTAAGVLLLFNPVFVKEWISILAGSALLVYGISELISSRKMKQAIDEYEIRRAEETETKVEDFDEQDAKDVDYQKID